VLTFSAALILEVFFNVSINQQDQQSNTYITRHITTFRQSSAPLNFKLPILRVWQWHIYTSQRIFYSLLRKHLMSIQIIT